MIHYTEKRRDALLIHTHMYTLSLNFSLSHALSLTLSLPPQPPLLLLSGEKLNPFMVNKLMTAALKLEMPDLAIDIFEDAFGFYFDPDPAKGNF